MIFLCDAQRHLICDPYSIENLHRMAAKLGIAACWFHIDHYDIPKKRYDEISKRCIIVRPRQICRIARGLP